MKIRVTGKGITVTARLRGHIDRCIRFALGRFSTRIGDLDVALGVEGDAKAHSDKSCSIAVRLVGLPEVSERCVDTDPYSAVNSTVSRVERSVARRLDTAWSLGHGLPVPPFPSEEP